MDQKRISIQMYELVRKMGPDNFFERYAFIFAQCLKFTQKVSFPEYWIFRAKNKHYITDISASKIDKNKVKTFAL